MAVDVYLENNVTYDSYLEPEIPLSGTIIGQGTAVTSINGISGPTVTFAGGTSGFSFAPGGTTITLVSPLTTKGDLYTHNSTVGIALSVGADTFVLTADSAQATGMKWAAPATAGTVTHTGTLTANQLILGNGGADVTALGSLGTATTVLHGNAGGAPTFAAVSLTADVSGTLPVGNGGTGITSLGTGVATALGINVGTAGAFVTNGGALGSPSSAGTIPAFTLGGTLSGGGNNINNVVIGASSPGAGTFTGVTVTNANTVLAINTTNTTGGINWDESGTAKAQLVISGGDTYFDYYGGLNFRSGFSGTQRVSFSSSGIITVASLAGVGTRNVVVDASGVMSAP